MENSTPCISETPENIGSKNWSECLHHEPLQATTMAIFVEIGPAGSAPHIAEI